MPAPHRGASVPCRQVEALGRQIYAGALPGHPGLPPGLSSPAGRDQDN